MALTAFQRQVCRLLADARVAAGEGYLAGGATLNEALGGARVSRDIDVFHDTEEAVGTAWDADRRLLEAAGYRLRVLRERPSYVEAEVRIDVSSVLVQWTRDSAFRFFPLVAHPELGLALHPFDLATNKVLALVGRLEARDWVDTILCHEKLQRLGFLAWAACGKDPGFSPAAILRLAARSSHYGRDEILELDFDGSSPSAARLSDTWRQMLSEADEIVAALPPDEAGTCVLRDDATLLSVPPSEIPGLLESGRVVFHPGRLRGAFPQAVTRPGPRG